MAPECRGGAFGCGLIDHRADYIIRKNDLYAVNVSLEDTVRQYLQYLEDPTKLIDDVKVDKLNAKVERAKDVIDKLRAIAELERAKSVDGTALEEAFIRDVRTWAESEGIPIAAFRQLGVNEETLARAGFEEARRRPRTRRANSRGGRARSTTVAEVTAWVLANASASFTQAEVQRSVGGSPATIKKAIDELTASGELTNLGRINNHSGRGRAPFHYRLAS